MCRMLASVAIAMALAAAPALAATPAAPPAKPSPPTTPTKAPPPAKATAEERAQAERLDPLARAAFWARVVDADPADADAGIKLAKALRALGRYDEAAAAADQVLVTQPTNLEALLESARAKIAAGQGFYAIDSAQRAEAVAPKDWRPVTLLGLALEQSQRDDDALAALRKAASMASDNPAVLSNLGMFYATHGDAASAEPLLRKAAAAPAAGAQERQNLALVLGLEGKLDEAEHLLRQDLPPAVVDNDVAYFRAGTSATGPRSWETLQQAQ